MPRLFVDGIPGGGGIIASHSRDIAVDLGVLPPALPPILKVSSDSRNLLFARPHVLSAARVKAGR